MKQTRRSRDIPLLKLRPPFQAIRGDRTGYMVLLEDRYGRPIWMLRSKFEKFILNG